MKWEYLKIGVLNEKTMDRFGKDGWELVAVIGYCDGSTATMFFKRLIKED